MARRIAVLFAAAEVVPFAKVGGLADVAGALPKALLDLGLDVRVAMPLYGSVSPAQHHLTRMEQPSSLTVSPWGEEATFWRGVLPDSQVDVVFVENQRFFGRSGIYSDPADGQGYQDNALRFAFFNRAILEWVRACEWKPQIFHGNDFHCGLMAAYLRTRYAQDAHLSASKTVFSIHNLAYQGRFPMELFAQLDLPDQLAKPMGALEFFGEINFMKAGLVFSEVINTVSERYAQEIQESADYGVGLEGVLRSRREDLYGILNGVDYEQWHPERDELIAFRYGDGNPEGKAKNKSVLLKDFGLPRKKGRVPLVGMISRLADQKGFDLILEKAEEILSLDLQLVILGTGQPEYQRQLASLQQRHSRQMGLALTFDNRLAHQIEAGADLFLMPSRYEPCGLNQMYSLKYGTIPIVRATGGLADTIRDFDQHPQAGNGFVFHQYRADEMLAAIRRSLRAYSQPRIWQQLVKRAMAADFSWARSAEKYRQLYLRALER